MRLVGLGWGGVRKERVCAKERGIQKRLVREKRRTREGEGRCWGVKEGEGTEHTRERAEDHRRVPLSRPAVPRTVDRWSDRDNSWKQIRIE